MTSRTRLAVMMVLLAVVLTGCGGWYLRGSNPGSTHNFRKVFLRGD